MSSPSTSPPLLSSPPLPDTIPPVSSPPPPPDANFTASSNPPVTTNWTTLEPRPLPSSGGIPPGALAGLITGTGLGAIIVLIGVAIFVFFRRKKRRKEADRLGLSGGTKDHPNAGLPQGWHHQNPPPPAEHKFTVLPLPVSPTGPGPVAQQLPNVGSDKPSLSTVPAFTSGLSQGTFTYEELSKATDNFSSVNLLGQGGFGYVHKGVLSNGRVVAVKQLKAGSGQGEREFQAEIDTISHVHHRHLVSLIGYCMTGVQRLLVYEFVPNNTLEFHLHGKGRSTVNWATRMKIAVGSAKGLAYLHEDCHPKIIHRDIKAANILLDHSFEAKVADFGLAKYSLDTDTHVSTRVMGTFGYMAPEYASSGKLTEKSDVFSFGVVLLELITGRRPVDRTPSFYDDSIVDWARPLLQQSLEAGNYDSLVDPNLQNDYDSGEIVRMIACAAACVRHSARLRPRMSQIVRALDGNLALDDLNEGITPGHSRAYGSFGSSDYNSGLYKEDLRKFRKLALESQELGSSEYSVIASDNGMQPSSSSTEGQQTTQEMEKTVRDSKEAPETLQEEEKNVKMLMKAPDNQMETSAFEFFFSTIGVLLG